jgi:hypothetical protein
MLLIRGTLSEEEGVEEGVGERQRLRLVPVSVLVPVLASVPDPVDPVSTQGRAGNRVPYAQGNFRSRQPQRLWTCGPFLYGLRRSPGPHSIVEFYGRECVSYKESRVDAGCVNLLIVTEFKRDVHPTFAPEGM